MKHPCGVFEAPTRPGWVRLIAVGEDGYIVAVSEFADGVFDIQSETRRLQSRLGGDRMGFLDNGAAVVPDVRRGPIALVR
jgi:hypothetical protein